MFGEISLELIKELQRSKGSLNISIPMAILKDSVFGWLKTSCLNNWMYVYRRLLITTSSTLIDHYTDSTFVWLLLFVQVCLIITDLTRFDYCKLTSLFADTCLITTDLLLIDYYRFDPVWALQIRLFEYYTFDPFRLIQIRLCLRGMMTSSGAS